MVFSRFLFLAYCECQADFVVLGETEFKQKPSGEKRWSAGAEYKLSKNISLTSSYGNRFGADVELSLRF